MVLTQKRLGAFGSRYGALSGDEAILKILPSIHCTLAINRLLFSRFHVLFKDKLAESCTGL